MERMKKRSGTIAAKLSGFAMAAVMALGFASTTLTAFAETNPSDFDFDASTGTITYYNGSETEIVVPDKINSTTVERLEGEDGFMEFGWGSGTVTSITIPAAISYIGVDVFNNVGNIDITFLGTPPELNSCFNYHTITFHVDEKYYTDYVNELKYTYKNGLKSYTIETFSSQVAGAEIIGVSLPENSAPYLGDGLGVDITVTAKNITNNDPVYIKAVNEEGKSRTASGNFIESSGTFTATVSLVFATNDYSGKYTISAALTNTDNATWVDATTPLTVDTYKPADVFIFTDDENGGLLVSGSAAVRHLVIPATYEGKPVTGIADSGFNGYSGIISTTLPSSIKTIGKQAFYDCRNMTILTLNEGLESIGRMAFQYCNSLTEVNIPSTVTNLYEGFRLARGLKNFSVATGSKSFSAINGVLFNKDGSVLIHYPLGRTDESYAIPEGTKEIGEEAFFHYYDDTYSAALKTVSFPSTIEKIHDRAFKQSSLTSITVKTDVEYGTYIFDLCKNLKTVVVEDGVKVLTKGMLYGLDNLETISLPGSLEEIGDEALQRLAVKELPLPEGLRKIGKDAFTSSKITSLTIPSTVNEIGLRAFYTMANLEDVTFTDTQQKPSQLESLGAYAFCQSRKLSKVNLPSSLKTIQTGAFSSCNALTALELPNGLTTLEDSVFAYSGIESVEFPDSVTSIGSYTFYNCYLLENEIRKEEEPSSQPDPKEIANPQGEDGDMNPASTVLTGLRTVKFPAYLENLGVGTFYNCNGITEIVFPVTVKIDTLPSTTFWNCSNLAKVVLPEVMEKTGNCIFGNTSANLVVEYKAKPFRRSPFDCGYINISENNYELREDGAYYTLNDIWVSEISVIEAGTKLEAISFPTFTYTGTGTFTPAIKSVTVPENAKAELNDEEGAQIRLVAEDAKAGDTVYIKAVGKTSGKTATANGTLARGAKDELGMFVSIKSILFNSASCVADEYEVSASLDNTSWVKAAKTITVEGEGGVTDIRVTGLELTPVSKTLKLGTSETSFTLNAIVKPEAATNKTVLFESSDDKIATVDADGVVSAVKAGRATITATTQDGNFAKSCNVTVIKKTVTSVTLNKTTATLKTGKTLNLTATVKPSNATVSTVKWSTSNKNVTVTQKGKVTAKQAGTVKVTATSTDNSTKKATCTITVKDPVKKVVLNKSALTLKKSKTYKLNASVTPKKAYNTKITWSSNKPKIAKVSRNGKVTAVKKGKATITATNKDSGKKATCIITVK